MSNQLRSILPISNPSDYKVHFARWNQHNHPLDTLARDRDEWQTWHEWKPAMHAFNRPRIFTLAEFYDEPHTWMFGGIFEVLETEANRYTVRLSPDGSSYIGKLKLTSSYKGRNVRVNFENHYGDLEVKEILSTPFWGGSNQIPNDVQKPEVAPSNNSSRGGQGYVLDAKKRKVIEQRAMELATEHYKQLGYNVRDVSGNKPYDLLCERSGRSLNVEVKGTTGAGETVIVTHGEVNSAREARTTTDLFIVSGIELRSTDDSPSAHGGVYRLLEDWHPDERDLSPTQYQYSIPNSSS